MEFEKDGFKFYKDVVVDTKTGLMWARNGNIAGKKMTWDTAMEWVKTLEIGGYRNWRLPTKEELDAFAMRGGEYPSSWFNANAFNNVQSSFYWSSSSYAHYANSAWGVYMDDSIVVGNVKANFYYIWPVRGGH